MKIPELYEQKKPVISFEIFPPKIEASMGTIFKTVDGITDCEPDFISVTYGAGGGKNGCKTIQIASDIQDRYGVESVAHMPCIGLTKEQAAAILDSMQDNGIENILALRGDSSGSVQGDFRHASDLITFIRENYDFNIIAACYPEVHPESSSCADDLKWLKHKVDCGAQYLVTQMFFDNNALYSFLYRALKVGIDVPVVAGIMPVINSKQIIRSCELSGATMPSRLRVMLDKFSDSPEALKQAGIAYATEQIIDLISNGVTNIHIYTMNKPEVAGKIMENLSSILAR